MRCIMITGSNSGSGKTTVAMGILRAFLKKGIDVCAFKTGPDYIDTAFLKSACKKDVGNLDMHLQGREGLKKALSMAKSDYAIIEGAMGYFDGIYNTYENSSFHIAKELNINSILVYTPNGEMFSAIPKIKGMAEFKNSTIKAVILNKVSESYYKLLKEQIENYTNVKVIGYIPKCKDFNLESRHLGLIQCREVKSIDEKVNKISSEILNHIDMDYILNLMKDVKTEGIDVYSKTNLKVSIAMDKAFSFYYRENLDLFEKVCNVSYFSPIYDSKIPKCHILYIGGGYPEVFKKELSSNKSMLLSIKNFAQSGGIIYAECGGLMYLLNEIEGENMVGIFNGKAYITDKLQHFGYININLKQDCLIGKAGTQITAHEFHKSYSKVLCDTIYNVKKPKSNLTWQDGFQYKNTFASYAHINFLGNMSVFKSIISKAQNKEVI